MASCPHCGKTLREGQTLWCNHCWEDLPPPEPNTAAIVAATTTSAPGATRRFCGQCGAPAEPVDKFCRSCGQPVTRPVFGEPVDPPVEPAAATPHRPETPWYANAVGWVLVGVVVLIIAAAGYVLLRPPGSLSFSPTVFTCSGETRTMSVRLPSSVQGTDDLTVQVLPDGVSDTQSVEGSGFTRQPDGSWVLTAATSDTSVAECRLPLGPHTIRFLDAKGRVLAEGGFTRQ